LSAVFAFAVLTVLLTAAPAAGGDNDDSIGVQDTTTGIWYVRGIAEGTYQFYFGNPGDYPIMGDWDCDDRDTAGLYRQSDGYVYLININYNGPADSRFFFGNPGDIPLAGDFNGDGCDTVSIYRPSEARFYIINELGTEAGGLGAADFFFDFGDPGDRPFVADFNNDGIDTIGLHRESTGLVYYRDSLATGVAENEFFYGDPGDQIIAGRWRYNPTPGPDTVGIFRPSNGTFYLRWTNSEGNADYLQQYGNSNMVAFAGRFGDAPGSYPPPPGPQQVTGTD
jgi:hypothetical protein